MGSTSEVSTGSRTHDLCARVHCGTSVQEGLLARARGEYREMPGMRLTLEQAMRLWDLDRPTCQSLLASLVDEQFLEIDSHGMYHMVHPGY
jgi:hypothetical protein